MSAAARLRAMDEDATDSLAPVELGDHPAAYDETLPVTLYVAIRWPLARSWDLAYGGECESDEIVRVDGRALCPDCSSEYGAHPYAPWPLDYRRERFVVRLCDGRLGKT